MEHIDRVLAAIELREPDRIPMDLGGPISGMTKVAYDNLKNYLRLQGLPSVIWDSMQGLVEIPDEILGRFDIDLRHIGLNPPEKEETKVVSEDTYTNEFGITLRKQYHGYYFEMVEGLNPLFDASSIDDVRKYKGPNPHEGRTRGLRNKARKFLDDGYGLTCDSFTGGILELAIWLRGFSKFYRDLRTNPELVDALLDKTLEVHKALWGAFLSEVGDYAQIVLYGDDYGMQRGMLISPTMWREKVKPRVRELVSFIKKGFKVKVQLHSCGSIRPIIGDLIEMGFDIINPVQPRAKDMDSSELKREFGERVCFHGGIDIQYVLPRGSVEDVEKEVATRIRDYAPGGGYILAAAHNIQPDVPPQNIAMMFDAGRKFGRYPISI